MPTYTVTNLSSSPQRVRINNSDYYFTQGKAIQLIADTPPTLPNCFTIYQGSTLIQGADPSYTSGQPPTDYGAFYRARGMFTRPSNTTAYVSGQLVANSTTAGSVVPVNLAVARKSGGSGKIKAVKLSKTSTTTTNASFRVHFYRDAPTASNGDGATWLTTSNIYLGYADITIDKAFTDEASGVGVPLDNSGKARDLIFDTATSSFSIYALVEARGAYTPASGETFTITAEVERN